MGSFLRPVGPLPSSAYWLRRGLVLVVVLAVVAAGWWLLGGRGSTAPTGSGSSPGPSASTGSTGPTSSPSTSPSTSTSTSASPSASHSSASPSPSSTPTCPDSAIKVLALTDDSSYAATADPHLTVQVTNSGTTPCHRDLGQAALELVVSSGSARVWSSDDCNPGGGHAVVTLKPRQTFSSTVVWTRTTSKPGCPAGQPKAGAGSYRLTARNLTVTSAPTAFTLR